MQEEEAREAEPADHPQLLLEPPLASRRSARAVVAGSSRLRQISARRRSASGPRSPGSGSRGRGAGRSAAARRAAAVSATASGCSPKRSAIAAGEASAEVALPRRAGSVYSSVLWRRTATSASWSAARAAGVGVDVAGRDAGDAEALRQPREPPVARPVAAPEGPLELDPEAVAAEGRREAAAEPLGTARSPRPAARQARRGRSPRGRRAPRGAQHRSSGTAGGAGRRGRGRVPACASVSSRQRFSPAGRALDQEGQVAAPRRGEHGELGAVIERTPGGWQACANSIAPQSPSWSVSANAS